MPEISEDSSESELTYTSWWLELDSDIGAIIKIITNTFEYN